MAININTLRTNSMAIGSSGPSGHADTWIKFSENDTWHEYEIKGAFDFTALISVGLMPEGSGISASPVWNYSPYAVEIGTDVTSIGEYVFYGCSSVTSMTIPASVTSIGEAAFSNILLTSVTFEGKTMEQVQNLEDGNGNKHYPWGISDTSIINVA